MDTEVKCANCLKTFNWSEAYKCQSENPLGQAFCPHCGDLIIEWNNILDTWEWIGENNEMNTGHFFPSAPYVFGWGISIPTEFIPRYYEKRLNIEKMKKAAALYEKPNDSDVAQAMKLIEKYAGDISVMSLDSALFHAATHGIDEAIVILINAGANVNYKSISGRTPLLEAASNGHIEAVKLLLDNGANPNDQMGVFAAHTPLILAALNGHTGIVEVLIKAGADVNRRNQWGHTALEHARTRHHKDMEKLILKSMKSQQTLIEEEQGKQRISHKEDEEKKRMTMVCRKCHKEIEFTKHIIVCPLCSTYNPGRIFLEPQTENLKALELITKAKNYYSQGKYFRAVMELSNALGHVETDPTIYVNLGAIYIEWSKDYKEAINQFSKALKKSPDYCIAKEQLELVNAITSSQSERK